MILTLIRYLDLPVLALALPLFLIAGLPTVGYAVAATAWLVQRGIQVAAIRGADRSDDARTIVGLLAGSMLTRGWLVAGAILAVGLLADREDGLAAAVLSIVLFTVYFSAQLLVRMLDRLGEVSG